MEITDILAQMDGLGSVARELGIDEAQAANGAEALLPALLGGFKKKAQAHPSGLDGLGGLLGQLGGGGLLDNLLAPQPTDTSHGNRVLGQVFGSKDVSRAVAQNAAQKSGLDVGVLKKMLPLLAMAVAGFMSKGGVGGAQQPSSGGGLGGLLGGLVGGFGGGGTQSGGSTSGLGSLLDMDGDGNPLDDILEMAGKMVR